MNRRCKRIINGKTYNTETSTRVFEISSGELFGVNSSTVLYQTRFGAFFLHEFEEMFFGEDKEDIKPLEPAMAQKWLEEHARRFPEVIEQAFGEMPEAGDTEAKFTLRLPQRLRDQLAAKAEENGQSLNAWMVRCLEGCAGRGRAQ